MPSSERSLSARATRTPSPAPSTIGSRSHHPPAPSTPPQTLRQFFSRERCAALTLNVVSSRRSYEETRWQSRRRVPPLWNASSGNLPRPTLALTRC